MHLHTESEYSLPDGMCRPALLAERAAAAGHPAVGLTDRGTLHAAVEFEEACRAKGVKPVLGCDLAWAPTGVRPVHAPDAGPRLTLFAESLKGWRNLVRVVSFAHLDAVEEGEPALRAARLESAGAGLIGLLHLPAGGLRPGEGGAVEWAQRVKELLGRDRCYIERRLQGGGSAPEGWVDELARRTGLRPVVTADVRYVDPASAAAYAQVRAVRGVARRDSRQALPFLSEAQMRARSAAREDEFAAALEIAHRCTVQLPTEPGMHFPRFVLPPASVAEEGPPGQREFDFLAARTADGVRRRYGIRDLDRPAHAGERMVVERMRRELETIRATGFVHYFLVVWDLVDDARRRGIAVGPGRGSGAGSLVAYALGITDVDPVRFQLFFERFLNPDRVSPPDFDIDFDPARRGEVIDHLRDRYGEERVAHILTFHRMGPRQAVRDAARVLELPARDADRLARRVPEDAAGAWWRRAEVQREAQRTAGSADAIRLARDLVGLPRNSATHAAGIVIGSRPLVDLVPVMRRGGHLITQFEMSVLARCGLLKIDLLGLTTLSVVRETLDQVERGLGYTPDLEAVRDDDPATLACINRGDTIGVFQLESPGMRNLLRRVRVERFDDLVALIALYRPGPMHLIEEFVRRGDRAAVVCDHPLLEPILVETRGLMIYQEQVLQAAHVLAGFSLARADLLRRAISEKSGTDMAAQREAFVEGCRRAHRIDPERAGRIFDAMERFAGYGFNKAHSVAYARLAYRCAWLKTHYVRAYMAAWLSSQLHDRERLCAGFAELRALGIDLLPPDINRSGAHFCTESDAIRFGLTGIRHVGADLAASAVAEREANGSFSGLMDFCLRVPSSAVHRAGVESLVKAGAFDAAAVPRPRLLHGVDAALAHGASARRDCVAGQMVLFGAADAETAVSDTALPDIREGAKASEAAAQEYEVLGIWLHAHPLTEWEWLLCRCGLDVDPGDPEAPIRRAGLIGGMRPSPDGDRVQLNTLTGPLDLLIEAGTVERETDLLRPGRAVIVNLLQIPGEKRSAPPAYAVVSARAVEALAGASIREIRFHIGAAQLRDEPLAELQRVLCAHPGVVPAVLVLSFPSGRRLFVRVGAPAGLTASRELVRESESILGLYSVYFDVAL